MEIKKLTILGKRDSVITMIIDNLESLKQFPNIEIVNNLGLPDEYHYHNPNFEIEVIKKLNLFDNCILGMINPNIKKKVVDIFNIEIDNFISLINYTSSISSTTTIGKGCMINSMVSIAAHSKVRNFVSINRNSSVGHHTLIDDFVTINPGVNIAGHCTIGNGTIIGMGANILDGVSIGKNVVIGAGSLVNRDIPDNVVAYGLPCKIIKNNE